MMACLHRYWLKEFTKYFVIIQMMILVLFVFIDYLSRMNSFLSSDITLARGLWYVMLKLPFMFVQLTPASLLLAVIASFGIMNRNAELTALKSSGISVYFLVKPALLAGMVLAGVMFLLTETLIPISMSKANHIRYQEMNGGPTISKGRTDIWIKSDHTMVHINHFNPNLGKVSGVTTTTMGEHFIIQHRLDAQWGYYEDGQWVFKNVVEQRYDPQKDAYEVERLPEKRMTYTIVPEDLSRMVLKSDAMSFPNSGPM